MDVSPSGEPSAIERKVNADGVTVLLPVTHTFISMGKTKVSREIMHILLEENEATRPALHSATVNQQTPPYKKSGRGWGSNPENLCVASSQVFCTPLSKVHLPTVWQRNGRSFLTRGERKLSRVPWLSGVWGLLCSSQTEVDKIETQASLKPQPLVGFLSNQHRKKSRNKIFK